MIPYVTPQSCKTNHYFQFSSLRCQDCASPGQRRSEDLLSCSCQTGYKMVENKVGRSIVPSIVCEKCNNAGSGNLTSSLDGSFCIKCPSDVGFNVKTGTCNNCPANSVATDRLRNGTRLSTRQCVSCVDDTKPGGGEMQACRRCHSSFILSNNDSFCSDCTVKDSGYVVSGGVCIKETFLQKDSSSMYKVEYGDTSFDSAFFRSNLRASQALCEQYSNFTACQVLGNLCVLLDYIPNGNDACKQYTDLVNSKSSIGVVSDVNRDWPVVMPWLFYQLSASDAPEVLDKKEITKKFERNEDINFVLAVYTLNGSFVGYETGLDSLQMCKDRPSKMAAASKFATTYRSSCSIAVKELKNVPMFLYDMFLALDDELYPVPVLMENYVVDDEKVNEGSDRDVWKLTRRFYVVDNLIGISLGGNQQLQYIRYSPKIELNIRLRSSEGEIYPPMLRIKYEPLDLNDEDVLNSNKEMSFAVTYEMDSSKIKKDTEIAVGCLSALAAILALIKVSAWRRRQGRIEIDFASFLKFILFCFGTFSTMLFWVVFGLSVQWLIFFKRQKTVSQLLPTPSQERLFLELVGITIAFKFIDVLHMLWSQISFEIFFVDWERPQGRMNQPTQGGEAGATDAPVSIWRTLFIANEWNEIQTVRKINPELQIFLVLFFLKVVGFEFLATTDPQSTTSVNLTTDYVGEYSKVLRFAILAIVFLSVEAVQWFFFAFIYERFVGDALGDFIDLCSMSNVSIFILENTQYGYYIHGRSVHGRADTNLWQMNEQLKREEDDLCGKRGLEPNSERQTFEVEVPVKFREQYEDVVRPLRQSDIQQQRRNVPNAPMGQDGRGSRLAPAVEKRLQAYNALNRFLSAFIDHSLRDLDYLVRDKLLFERILNMELKELPPPDKAIFYNDDGRSFNSILFYGNEWTLMFFDLLIFAAMDLIYPDYVLAGIISYLFSKALTLLRNSLGRKNLTRKTLVDERFLI
ncbi:hypothetical protein ACROYT_G031787 [Oculina patagonica]